MSFFCSYMGLSGLSQSSCRNPGLGFITPESLVFIHLSISPASLRARISRFTTCHFASEGRSSSREAGQSNRRSLLETLGFGSLVGLLVVQQILAFKSIERPHSNTLTCGSF